MKKLMLMLVAVMAMGYVSAADEPQQPGEVGAPRVNQLQVPAQNQLQLMPFGDEGVGFEDMTPLTTRIFQHGEFALDEHEQNAVLVAAASGTLGWIALRAAQDAGCSIQ